MVIFGFFGGVTGIILSVEQLNMLSHNNLRVPGHFHMTVAADPQPLEAQPLPLEREPEPIEEEKDRVIHQVNLQTMTKPALKLYAAREFNKNFDDTMSIQAMRTEVRNLRIGAGMRNG